MLRSREVYPYLMVGVTVMLALLTGLAVSSLLLGGSLDSLQPATASDREGAAQAGKAAPPAAQLLRALTVRQPNDGKSRPAPRCGDAYCPPE